MLRAAPLRRLVLALALACGASPALAGRITGSVTYLARIAVPPGAVLEVALRDISRQDGPAVTLSLMRYALKRVPAPFELSYDDALIDAGRRYAVQARIIVDGREIFRTEEAQPVLTRGAGDTVEIVVNRAAGAEARTGLDDTAWEVIELRGRLLTSERRPTIRFGRDGRFGADSTCNRYAGQATIEGTAITFPEAMAGTRMACEDPYDRLERDFVAALGDVAGHVAEDGAGLALVNAAGVVVMRLVPVR